MLHVNSLNMGSRLLPLSFDCKEGEVLHIIGPNGSGKSTLLSCIAGLLTYKGTVLLDARDVAKTSSESLAQYRAFLSQSGRPPFNIDVYQFLSLSIPPCSKHKADAINQAVEELTHLLQVNDKLLRPIHHLSGGEWQRVRLCAICLQIWPTLNPYAQLLLLDEPAAPLDIGQEVLLYRLIDRVASMGIAVVMSNHDLNRTLKHASKTLLLDKGVCVAFGATESVLNAEVLSEVYQTRVRKLEIEQEAILLFD